MEGERKRRGDGLGLMLALIRDSFFFRLSAALGNAIQRGARESLLVRWLTTAPKQPRGGLCHELLVTRPAAMVKRLRQWLAAQVQNSFLLRLWRAVVRHLLSLDMVSWGGGMLAFGITLLAVTTFRFLGGQLLTFAGIQLAFSVAAIISGLLSGIMVGIGGMSGGEPVLAGLLLLGDNAFETIASSSWVVFWTGLFGICARILGGGAQWDVILPLVLGDSAGALFAPHVARFMTHGGREKWLMSALGVLLIAMAVKSAL